MRFINRKVPIAEVARKLRVCFDGATKLHCWHPERHRNNDRNASVGIRTTGNTVKCFGCDTRSMGPIDFVMDVLGLSDPSVAALWIAERFDVPSIPKRKHLKEPARGIFRAGHEKELGLLIRSGLWSMLSPPARSIAPVLVECAETATDRDELVVQISYQAITRFSGIKSPNAIRRALERLAEIGWMRLPLGSQAGRGPNRDTATYVLTPRSDQLYELAQSTTQQFKLEIAVEKKVRAQMRRERIQKLRARSSGTLLNEQSNGVY